jgi:2-polyprenyl-3-methyl-5-hydroxy-6-metoxy-1,4-benzoquinol methylase
MKKDWLRINSLGPYNHTNFTFQGKQCSHEGVLKGREDFLRNLALEKLRSFEIETGKNRKDIKVLEIGSFDGFISSFLYHRGYRRVITFEGRRRNIKKGKALRRILGQRDRVKHFKVNAERIPKFILFFLRNRFDFVICFGLLHHLQNPNRLLTAISKMLSPNGLVLLETVSIDDSVFNDTFREAVELKDILYRDGNESIGFLAMKLESDYFPGSTIENSFTTIPSKSGLRLLLKVAGMEEAQNIDGWEKERSTEQLGHRRAVHTSVLLCQKHKEYEAIQKYGFSTDAIADYEDTFCLNLVDINRFEMFNQLESDEQKKEFLSGWIVESENRREREILQSIMYSPKSKALFERAKICLKQNRREEGIQILKSLVQSDFCEDWRTTYRSLYLLAAINRRRYLYYARRCNPNFPKSTYDKCKRFYGDL